MGNWRNNWAVKNVLSEIPIAGSFFRKPSLKEAASGICKESFMYAGSTAAMAFVMIAQEDEMMMGMGHTLIMVAEMAFAMAGGTFVSHVAYNGISSIAEKVSGCFSSNTQQQETFNPLLVPAGNSHC